MKLRDRLNQLARDHCLPLTAHLELTYRCNFKCLHCYLGHARSDELETAEVLSLLDALSRAGTMFLTISGGEPLLRQDLPAILAHGKRKNFLIRLFTNGSLVDDDMVDLFLGQGISEVHISYYGVTAEVFDRVTGVPGSHIQVNRAVRALREAGVVVNLKVPIMKINISEREGIKDFASGLGCSVVLDPEILPRTDGDRWPCTLRVSEAGLDALYAQEGGAGRSLKGPVEKTRFSDLPCGAARTSCAIDPAGRVRPCVIFPQSAGDLKAQPFEQIWRDSELMRQVRAYRLSHRQGSCTTCEVLQYCEFCPARALSENGDPLQPDQGTCAMAHSRAKAARGRNHFRDTDTLEWGASPRE